VSKNPTHQPLSKALSEMVAHGGSETIRIGELVEGTEERGFYLLMILLSLPFVLPIPLPALSNVWGLAVVVISFRLAWRLPPRLPSFLAKREISRQRVEAFLRKTGSSLQVIEKLVKPRVGNWMTWPPARFANAMLLALMGFLLAIPLPAVLPFTHSLPCWSIIIIALAMMERDGVLIWIGYLLGLGTFAYMVFFTGLVVVGIHRLFSTNTWPISRDI
jgi:hypothetical protein